MWHRLHRDDRRTRIRSPTLLAALRFDLVAVLPVAYVAGAGDFLLYFRLLDRVGPFGVSLLEYVIPIFVALVGWRVLGETLSRATVTGSLLMSMASSS